MAVIPWVITRSPSISGEALREFGNVRLRLVSDTYANESAWGSNLIEPSSMRLKEEQVLLQGESALPTSVSRLSQSSPLYPRK